MTANGDADFLNACDTAALTRSSEGDQDGNWIARSSTNLQKCSAQLQRELLEKKIFTFFSEWCSRPKEAQLGVAFRDVTVLFNEDGSLQFKTSSPQNNVYLAVPHSLSDPVLAGAVEVVKKFLSQTFWGNKGALRSIFAALLLALAGANVDRCFWTIGPGGVGQSLFTHLISAMLEGLHSFIDTNVFYSDEEFLVRKYSFESVVFP